MNTIVTILIWCDLCIFFTSIIALLRIKYVKKKYYLQRQELNDEITTCVATSLFSPILIPMIPLLAVICFMVYTHELIFKKKYIESKITVEDIRVGRGAYLPADAIWKKGDNWYVFYFMEVKKEPDREFNLEFHRGLKDISVFHSDGRTTIVKIL